MGYICMMQSLMLTCSLLGWYAGAGTTLAVSVGAGKASLQAALGRGVVGVDGADFWGVLGAAEQIVAMRL